MGVLLLGLLLAGAFFGGHTMLRRYGDGRLYRRATLTLIALIFVAVLSIVLGIQLGLITDHYP